MKEKETDAYSSSSGPVAPDGGWGWVIVFAVFVGNCLMDGCIGSYGIFYPVLLSAFDSGPALTSMAGSLLVATYQVSCPVVGILSQKYGCRLICFVGGCIGAVGFILASLASSIAVFMVTFGVVVGIGTGMNFLPGHVITNTYFDKKRGIAGGIVCAGAGFGLFIMAPVCQLLISSYGWRGAMLVIGGIFLQLCVCAALMRPLPDSTTSTAGYPSTQNSEESESLLLPEGIPNGVGVQEVTLICNGVLTSESQTQVSEAFISNRKHCDDVSSLRDTERAENILRVKGPIARIMINRLKSSSDNALTSKTKHNDWYMVDDGKSRSLQHIPKESNAGLQLIPANSQFLHPLAVRVSKQRIYANGSKLAITDIECVTEADTSSSCNRATLDFSIFKNRNYLPLLLGAVFIQMGQFIPNTFLPEYCYTIGLNNKEVSIIMAIYGIVNIFGRLTAGCLANWRRVDALWLCNLGMFMCGIGCALFPVCTSFSSLCAFAVGVGYFIGYFPPLQILIMVEHLGVEKLSSALGILMFAKGPAALFGPPIAGLVYSSTNNYALSIVFAAILFLLSAAIQSLVPLLNICSKQQKKMEMDFEIEVEPEDR